MKLMQITIVLVGMLYAGFASAEVMPACNAVDTTCAVELEWDNSGGVDSCLDEDTTSSCTQNCPLYDPYFGCLILNTHYNANCVMAENVDAGFACVAYNPYSSERIENQEQTTACGGSGYCGWRDGVNKTGSSAVGNAARAKLHVCNSTGKSAESNWNSDNSACHDAEASYNDYCTTTVWEDLCDGYLPPVKK